MAGTELHPFPPFLPENAGILFLGSFPPQPRRWSMPFFYPNWTNDFWRVMGLLFHNDKDWFAIPGEKRFDMDRVLEFCREQGVNLAQEIRDNTARAIGLSGSEEAEEMLARKYGKA